MCTVVFTNDISLWLFHVIGQPRIANSNGSNINKTILFHAASYEFLSLLIETTNIILRHRQHENTNVKKMNFELIFLQKVLLNAHANDCTMVYFVFIQ